MEFLEELKNEIRPNDSVLNEADKFIKKLNGLLKLSKIKAKCVKGGSTAKGTFLKGDFDVDIFAVFDQEYVDKDISKILFSVLKQFNPEIVHGSRDYFHIFMDKLKFEIVPTLFVKDVNNIQNVTDMSPHHVAWVNKRLNDSLRDDIRLMKRFCKAQNIYGAESYIGGFSGHVIDLLIIYYGGFMNLFKAATKWSPKVIIDIEQNYRNPLDKIDSSKTQGPLIIVDPVQPLRNAAAAINEEKFNVFVKVAKEFIKNPSKEFFILKEFDLEKIKKDNKDKIMVTLKVVCLKGKTDIIGAKIVKVHELLKRQIEFSGFTIFDSGWTWDKMLDAKIYFVINEKNLEDEFIRIGPPLNEKKSCESFKEKNKNAFVKNGRLMAKVKRKFVTVDKLLNSVIKEDYIKTRVKKISLI